MGRGSLERFSVNIQQPDDDTERLLRFYSELFSHRVQCSVLVQTCNIFADQSLSIEAKNPLRCYLIMIMIMIMMIVNPFRSKYAFNS